MLPSVRAKFDFFEPSWSLFRMRRLFRRGQLMLEWVECPSQAQTQLETSDQYPCCKDQLFVAFRRDILMETYPPNTKAAMVFFLNVS